MKLKIFVFALFIAGCTDNGCSGEKFTVILSSTFPVEETAEVELSGKTIGFVESIAPAGETKRALVRVQDIASVTDADRIVPWIDGRGKKGLRILARQGTPLQPGAEINADSQLRRRREKLGEQPADMQTGRQDRMRAREERQRDRQANEGRFDRQSGERSAGMTDPKEIRGQRLDRALSRIFKDEEGIAQVDSPGANRFKSLGAELVNKPPEEVAAVLERDGDAISQQLHEDAKQARASGDMESARKLRRMESQIKRLSRQAGLQGAPGAREGRQGGERKRYNRFQKDSNEMR